MVVFVFNQAISYGKTIGFLKGWGDGCMKSQLLGQAPCCAILWGLPGVRMTAAGVRPETAGVILAGGTSLEEEATGWVEEKNRKGAVKEPLGVRTELLGGADRPVILVHQHNRVGHGP